MGEKKQEQVVEPNVDIIIEKLTDSLGYSDTTVTWDDGYKVGISELGRELKPYITSLASQVDELKQTGLASENLLILTKGEVTTLTTDNKRLREALEEVTKLPMGGCVKCNNPCEVCYNADVITTQALDPNKEGK